MTKDGELPPEALTNEEFRELFPTVLSMTAYKVSSLQQENRALLELHHEIQKVVRSICIPLSRTCPGARSILHAD